MSTDAEEDATNDASEDAAKYVIEHADELYEKFRKIYGPAFGMWKDREDMKDVAAYIRKMRERDFVTFHPDAPNSHEPNSD